MKVNHIQVIRNYWNSEAEMYHETHPEHLDLTLHPSWGLHHTPEKELKILDGHVFEDTEIVDLGCGRGQDSVGYALLGARVLAVDVSDKQLDRAISHPNVKYLQASAENLQVPDESFDIAISDHGAFDHSPAPLLLQEMYRILKPNGILVICTYSPLAYACYNSEKKNLSNKLLNDYPRNTVKYDGKIVNVEYSYADWTKMFGKYGFVIEKLEELIIPPEGEEYFSDLVKANWSSRWPCDIIWRVRKS